MSGFTVVSFGGGVNSTAMLIGMHEKKDRPDAILFADTGGEHPETYKHVAIVSGWCRSIGFPEVTTVSYSESRHGTLEQECLNNETLPSKAFGFSGCSVKWKRQPMDKWIDSCEPANNLWKSGGKVTRCIGIHFGEVRRGKIPDTDKYHFPIPAPRVAVVAGRVCCRDTAGEASCAKEVVMLVLPSDEKARGHRTQE